MFIFTLFIRYLGLFLKSLRNLSTQRLRGWLILVAVSVAASGCTMAKLGYDMVPTWSHWQLDRYFALDDEQRVIVGRSIDALHRWHRTEQLPGYVAFLKRVDEQMQAPRPAGEAPDAALIARWRVQVTDAWNPVAERLAPAMAELAVTLRPEQIDRLQKRLDESNVEYREKTLPDSPQARERARAERVLKRAAFFLGSLDAAQERELRTLAARLPASEETWLAERLRRQRSLIALLRKLSRDKPALAEGTRLARDYLLTMWTPQEGRRASIEESTAASDALSARMLAGATARQQAYFIKTVRTYATDFQSLSGIAVASQGR